MKNIRRVIGLLNFREKFTLLLISKDGYFGSGESRALKPSPKMWSSSPAMAARKASPPGVEMAGYPPGIWPEENRGWHFQGVTGRGQLREFRNMTPPSQGGEVWRAMANRVLDMICPGGAFRAPWELWSREREPRLPAETGEELYARLFGAAQPPPLWSNWTNKHRDMMRRHGRINPT